jgi:hypothetical protein
MRRLAFLVTVMGLTAGAGYLLGSTRAQAPGSSAVVRGQAERPAPPSWRIAACPRLICAAS